MTIDDKIKNVLGGNKTDEHHHTGTTMNTPGGTVPGSACNTCVSDNTPTSGMTGVAYNQTEYDTVQTTTQTTQVTAPTAAVCGTETFTKVEDRPIVIEQKEYMKEHVPYEKEFVREVRFEGERELTDKRSTEILGTEERIIAQAQPKSPCE